MRGEQCAESTRRTRSKSAVKPHERRQTETKRRIHAASPHLGPQSEGQRQRQSLAWWPSPWIKRKEVTRVCRAESTKGGRGSSVCVCVYPTATSAPLEEKTKNTSDRKKRRDSGAHRTVAHGIPLRHQLALPFFSPSAPPFFTNIKETERDHGSRDAQTHRHTHTLVHRSTSTEQKKRERITTLKNSASVREDCGGEVAQRERGSREPERVNEVG